MDVQTMICGVRRRGAALPAGNIHRTRVAFAKHRNGADVAFCQRIAVAGVLHARSAPAPEVRCGSTFIERDEPLKLADRFMTLDGGD